MLNSEPEVEQVTKSVSTLLEKINSEFGNFTIDSDEPVKGTAFIGFQLGREYFLTARDAIEQGHVIGSGCAIRSNFENLADMMYILKSGERIAKYAKNYVLSLETYRQAMVGLHDAKAEDVFGQRMAKQVNKWAGNATIDDRMKDLTPVLLTVYDMFSYFSHPNPAAIVYMGRPNLKKAQLKISSQVNCHVALSLMILSVKHGGIKSVTIKELFDLLDKLGIPRNKKLTS